MSDREAFCYFLQQLHTLNADLGLRLPASRQTLYQQVQRLHHTQRHLDALKRSILKRFRHHQRPSQHHFCRTLLRIVYYTQQQANTFQMLADEFALDPQGSLACLGRVEQRHQRLMHSLKTLETRHQSLTPPKTA